MGGIALTMLLTTTNGWAADSNSGYGRIRAGLRREPVASRLVVTRLPATTAVRSQSSQKKFQSSQNKPHTSLWRGAAIGAGIGALIGGVLWAPSLCSSNDSECTAITVPIGLAGGAGIGAAVGAITQALAR